MALWDRVSRLFSTLSQERLDERVLVGVQEVIASMNPQCHVPNPIVPSAQPNGRVRETDHVMLVGGTVFVVEVKNYKGRMVWEDSTHHRLLQMKTGRYGESIEPKKPRIPCCKSVVTFIRQSNTWLVSAIRASNGYAWSRWEPSHDGDITAIHSLDEGLVYVDELPTFFLLRRNERFADRPSGWIVNGLESLPRLDGVRTEAGHLFRGVFGRSQSRISRS